MRLLTVPIFCMTLAILCQDGFVRAVYTIDIYNAFDVYDRHKRRNDSVIVDHLQGQYKSHVQCSKCGKVSITFDPFTYALLV